MSSFVQVDERSPIDPATTATTAVSLSSSSARKQQQPHYYGYSTFRINNNNSNNDSNREENKEQKKYPASKKKISSVWSFLSSYGFISSPPPTCSTNASPRQQHAYLYQNYYSTKESSLSSPRISCINNFNNNNNISTVWVSSSNKRYNNRGINGSSSFRSLIQRLVMKCPWRLVLSMLVCVAVSMFYYRPHHHHYTHENHHHHHHYEAEPEWSWDHNVYNPARGGAPQQNSKQQQPWQEGPNNPILPNSNNNNNNNNSPRQRNLLLAQVAGSSALVDMAEITSRPNRAYARQWGRDYVLYKAFAQSLERTCFDKVVVLNAILEKQQQLLHPPEAFSSSLGVAGHDENRQEDSQQEQQARSVQYDVVALLPPDATITNLDSDLLNLMPPDKLLAMARWQLPATRATGSSSSSSPFSSYSKVTTATTTMTQALSSGIVLFNLRHKYASRVVKLWYSMVEEPPSVSCGAGNDLLILLHAVQTVLEQEELYNGRNNHNHYQKNNDGGGMSDSMMQAISSVVASLDESDDGFVGDYRSIKTIPLAVPTSKAAMLVANEAESQAELQKTADSVCYRYYPKCEVL